MPVLTDKEDLMISLIRNWYNKRTSKRVAKDEILYQIGYIRIGRFGFHHYVNAKNIRIALPNNRKAL